MKCRRCNATIPQTLLGKDSFRCPSCGYIYRRKASPAESQIKPYQKQNRYQLHCRRCKSTNVSVEIMQTGSQTKSAYKTKQRGCLGTLIWLGCFGWMITLFKPKKYKTKGSSTTVVTHEKIAICHDCGHSWTLKK